MTRDAVRCLSMETTKKNHVPGVRHFADSIGKHRIELGIKNSVIFKDQNALPGLLAGRFDHRQMAAQTTECAGRMFPLGWHIQSFAVQGREANHVIDVMLRKAGFHFFPAVASSVQVDADLVWEEIADVHRAVTHAYEIVCVSPT